MTPYGVISSVSISYCNDLSPIQRQTLTLKCLTIIRWTFRDISNKIWQRFPFTKIRKNIVCKFVGQFDEASMYWPQRPLGEIVVHYWLIDYLINSSIRLSKFLYPPKIFRYVSHFNRSISQMGTFLLKMVRCEIFAWCILGYGRWIYKGHAYTL